MRLSRLFALALAALLALTGTVWAEVAACPPVETGVEEISRHGNLKLDISVRTLIELGYEYGDVIRVEVGDRKLNVPICHKVGDVDVGAPFMCVELPNQAMPEGRVVLLINMGDLATALGLGEKVEIPEAPGYRWDLAEPYRDGISVKLSLVKKGGYLSQLDLHGVEFSDVREDYPLLTDEEYANFRAVTTTGMGANALYRSSSPINPKYDRNREADAAVNRAGICTVMNMSDSERVMKSYEDYAYTYYSKLDIIALDMMVDFASEDFESRLAEGFRFLIAHQGPYLIHCVVGKDRTGFACAILECLMGASADEVVTDYMVTYYNYYVIVPGTAIYEKVANSNVRHFLATAFGVESIYDADLRTCAEEYLRRIGMTDGEIDALRTRLGTDVK